MDKSLLKKLNQLKIKYQEDGFIVLGVFGSFARGEATNTSDIDILYDCTEVSFKKFPGLAFFGFYEDVKKVFEETLGRKVDLVDRKSLRAVGEKYILPEVIYV